MRLAGVKIEGFRSIATVADVTMRRELTCLIGANEHGKSNLLHALNLLDKGEFEEFDKYERSKSDSHPRLTFSLVLSRTELKGLTAAIRDELEKLPEDDEPDSRKTRRLFSTAIDRIRQDASDRCTVTLEADNSRHLTVGGVIFHFGSAALPASRKGRIQLWYEENVPRVQLFEPTAELADSISLTELNAGKNKPFEGLLKLAGVWDDADGLFAGTTAAQRSLIEAGRRLTRKVRRIWSQGSKHKFHFSQNGGRLHLAIEDPVSFDTPSRRSLGFKSFFSFYLSLFAETEDVDPEGYVLLFDEPGIHLHPQGQKDLLRELRNLSRNNQIVYATHSPFMIDRNDLSTTMLVRKGGGKSDRGTQILTRPYGENWAALNAALGISPADAFYPPDRVLLVEGRSDRLYVSKYMALCQRQTKADLNFLSIADAEERSALPNYIRLLLVGSRQVVVLSDGDQGGDDMARHLRKIAGKRKDQLSFIDLRHLSRSKKPVSIEDALPFEPLIAAVRQYVTLILQCDCEVIATDIEERARTVTMATAIALHLVAQGALKHSSKLSRTSIADLYCRLELGVPDRSTAMARLCETITHTLGLLA